MKFYGRFIKALFYHCWVLCFLLFLGQKLKRIHTSIIGTGSVCCSFVLCLFLFSSFLAGGNNLADKNFEYYFYPWLELDGLQVSVSFLLDSLSFVMVLIITGVGFLIHLYSVGYMKEEKSYSESFLNLFVFFMLILAKHTKCSLPINWGFAIRLLISALKIEKKELQTSCTKKSKISLLSYSQQNTNGLKIPRL